MGRRGHKSFFYLNPRNNGKKYGLSDKPKKVAGFKVDRNPADPRNAMITWKVQPDAIGYTIYYGIAPDKLYNSIMVYEGSSYDFRGLDKGTEYYFAIEAFNENGIGPRMNTAKFK